ncbi:alkaline phosphatase [Neobacillus sp. LXY-4]|uniref:alkaline phosphatase n=1 Tax=Neobacillus sp. LXY-4 TaxID=3379826 RepID=UPI003EE0C300
MVTFKRVLLIPVLITALFLPKEGVKAETAGTHKNVIMMVMDGTNSSAVTLARWYKGGPLALDEILVGGVRTASLRSAITDSPAAGTALATGNKTIAHVVGMVPRKKDLHPVVNLSEAAKRAGLATGIVSTSEIQNATPASYSSHVTDRYHYDDIAEQQVYGNFDVVLGGGKRSLLRRVRTDQENLVAAVERKGYQVVENKDELAAAVGGKAGKVWGSFASNAMSNHFDREFLTPGQPTLAEMTEAALGVLSGKDRGFFLFVEGSKVDWAAHKNDPVGMVSEVLGFDEAVGKALEFAKQDGNTLVIAVTDHGNSGLTIGNRSTDKTYMDSGADLFVKPLKKAELTLEGALATLEDDRGNLREVAASYGLKDLSGAEWRRLKYADGDKGLEKEMSRMLSRRAKLGFTTYGHTGEDVFLYAFGPGKPGGLIDNTEIAGVVARHLGFELNGGVRYVEAREFFEGKGYGVKVRGARSANPVLVVERDGEVLEYPENKNYFVKNGVEQVETAAPNVFNGKEFFVAVP